MLEQKSKIIFEACPHYNNIINHQKQDHISQRLVHYYSEYIFNINLTDQEELEKIKKLDQIIYEYITNIQLLHYFEMNFERKMQEDDEKAYFDELIDTIIELYEQYQKDQIIKISNSKWIS